MIYFLNLIINGFYLYFFLSILVNQYYSLKRLFKISFRLIFNRYNIVIFLVSIVSLVFLKEMNLLYLILNLGLTLLFIVINKPLKFKKTRRNLTLFCSSLILSWILIPLYVFTSLVILTCCFLLLLPLEKMINKRFIKSAREKLKKINPIVIGITGSYGKTTFKNILYDVLKSKYRVEVTRGNINTLLGITKFINQELKDDIEIFIVELGIDEINGMNKFKEILTLDIGVITSIGENHLSNFKTIENTFKAKLKIKNLLKEEGKLLINNDDSYLSSLKENEHIFNFSKKNINQHLITIEGLKFEYNNQEILLPLYGKYIYSYLDGIIKISEFLGLNEDYITFGLTQIKKINRRLEVKKFKNGYFINDSYNININGVKESVELLKSLEGNNAVIIGGIIEQGKHFISSNNKIKDILKDLNVIFIGKEPHPLIKNHQYKNLYIVYSLKDAYILISKLSFTNILLLAKSDDIFLR